MGEQAVAMAKAVDYQSAGTVEFIVDTQRNFYFLEMNTRLQVEHPVTELITGVDLVELMIRVADGEKLPLTQADVGINGWAIESRVYAEDPYRNFLPSTGRLVYYRPPEDDDHVRVDTGVFEGGEVSMFYDPMIAKLVTHGPDRPAAIAAMQAALDGFAIRGIAHNTSFLAAVMAHERFHEGRLTTNFIAEEFPDGFHGGSPAGETLARLLAVAVVLQRVWDAREARISGQLAGRAKTPVDDWVVVTAEDSHPVTLSKAGAGEGEGAAEGDGYRVTGAAGDRFIESAWRPGQALFRGRIDGRPVTVQVERRGPWWRLTHGGARLEALVLTARAAELAARMPRKEPPDLSRFLLSPMPGLLVSLAVETGQEVKAGEELAVVEAMKMENVLRAQRDGVVAKVHVEPGASLTVDQAILEFE
jgi:propionyl-CoA carboxylase alpha chain